MPLDRIMIVLYSISVRVSQFFKANSKYNSVDGVNARREALPTAFLPKSKRVISVVYSLIAEVYNVYYPFSFGRRLWR